MITKEINYINYLEEHGYFEQISDLAQRKDVEVYISGGYVRDIILDRKKNEIDFLVVGDGPGFAQDLAQELKIKKVNIFKNFEIAHIFSANYGSGPFKIPSNFNSQPLLNINIE